MKIFIYSEKGKGKNICEDAAIADGNIVSDSYFESEIEENGIVAIADGVGGNAGGDYASKYVLSKLNGIFINKVSCENLKKHITDINTGLLDYASTIAGKENMATTLTGVIITMETRYIFHIGNTRIYRLQGNYLKQFTEDQTTYQWLLNMGQADNAEACNKNEITHCLGGGANKYASGLQIKRSDALKLCKRTLFTTDGIHEYVTLDELEDFIVGEVDDKTMRSLAKKASSNGSSDDKTIIVIDRV